MRWPRWPVAPASTTRAVWLEKEAGELVKAGTVELLVLPNYRGAGRKVVASDLSLGLSFHKGYVKAAIGELNGIGRHTGKIFLPQQLAAEGARNGAGAGVVACDGDGAAAGAVHVQGL